MKTRKRTSGAKVTSGRPGTNASRRPPTTRMAAYGTASRSAIRRSPTETARRRRMSSRPARTAPSMIANYADDFTTKTKEYAVADRLGEGEPREPGRSYGLGRFSTNS